MARQQELMMKKMRDDDGFIAALDQSGGSTPGALRLFGINDDEYIIGEKSMFDQIHNMRTRIITSPKFNANNNHGVIGAILFDDTMRRKIEGMPTADYLWKIKCIVPFLKIDKGLEVKKDGVELMKIISNLDEICNDAVAHNIFGTKMRSVIHSADRTGIKKVVAQQFEVGKQIIANGLVPIIEPEVSIESKDKRQCEELLLAEIIENLRALSVNQKIILKLTLPEDDDRYKQLIDHPSVIRVVALSGGHSRAEAVAKLKRQHGVIASFSRALTEGLTNDLSQPDFDNKLGSAIDEIFDGSCKKEKCRTTNVCNEFISACHM